MTLLQAPTSQPAGRAASSSAAPPPATPHDRLSHLARQIAAAKLLLKALNKEHHRLALSIRMKAKHQNDHAFVAKFRAARMVPMLDPVEKAAWQKRVSKACRKLPKFTERQRRDYNQYRWYRKMSREKALQYALNPAQASLDGIR